MIVIGEETFAYQKYFGNEPTDEQMDFISELLSNYTCIICCGVAVDPVKCQTCETVYCYGCLPDDGVGKTKQVSYYNPAYECYRKCGSRKNVDLSKLERAIINNLPFTCQHADEHGCEAVVKYEDMKKHLKNECV